MTKTQFRKQCILYFVFLADFLLDVSQLHQLLRSGIDTYVKSTKIKSQQGPLYEDLHRKFGESSPFVFKSSRQLFWVDG